MKKLFTLTLAVCALVSVEAQKKVAYISKIKAMDNGTATIIAEPGYTILANDPAFTVELIRCDASKFLEADGTTEKIVTLSNYDVIVIQESIGGGDAILMPTGKLALATLPKPTLYNKQFALKAGRAITTGAGGTDASNILTVTIDAANQTNDLFKGFDFTGGSDIKLFNATTTDGGTTGLTGSTKALSYTASTVLDPTNAALAKPTGVATISTFINDIPAATNFGGQVTANRIITVGYNYGAMCNNGGLNITKEGLTIWRNAVYILAGLAVPATLAEVPAPTATALSKVKKDNGLVLAVEGGIKVSASAPSKVSIYSIDGKMIASKQISGTETIACQKGVYMVRVNNSAVKVMVSK